jgi:hypothetical protein
VFLYFDKGQDRPPPKERRVNFDKAPLDWARDRPFDYAQGRQDGSFLDLQK